LGTLELRGKRELISAYEVIEIRDTELIEGLDNCEIEKIMARESEQE